MCRGGAPLFSPWEAVGESSTAFGMTSERLERSEGLGLGVRCPLVKMERLCRQLLVSRCESSAAQDVTKNLEFTKCDRRLVVSN